MLTILTIMGTVLTIQVTILTILGIIQPILLTILDYPVVYPDYHGDYIN